MQTTKARIHVAGNIFHTRVLANANDLLPRESVICQMAVVVVVQYDVLNA